ncbi:MAG: P1 family peptidase [Candidatus Aminicenantes bacterium]
MKKTGTLNLISVILICLSVLSVESAQENFRARDLGIPLEGTPGALNAITDVKGVEVGHKTLIQGEGDLKVGEGPIRTGVTAVLPLGKNNFYPVFAAWFSLNGNGEMTGTTWIEESGRLEGPIMITNTLSVGMVHHSVIAWGIQRGKGNREYDYLASLPVVAETWDGYLNDIYGQHVKKEHVFYALNRASSGPVDEGCVGGGTGMICHGFKGGIGTSSRTATINSKQYTVGVLVQANYGRMKQLKIAGVPVGREIAGIWEKEEKSKTYDLNQEPSSNNPIRNILTGVGEWGSNPHVLDKGSIIIVIATDAPVLPHQLKRLARRASLGLARNGSVSMNSSGDIFIAFSNANQDAGRDKAPFKVTMFTNSQTGQLFAPTIQATEEAIINALVAAETMTGVNGRTIRALPHDLVKKILGKYNRLNK